MEINKTRHIIAGVLTFIVICYALGTELANMGRDDTSLIIVGVVLLLYIEVIGYNLKLYIDVVRNQSVWLPASQLVPDLIIHYQEDINSQVSFVGKTELVDGQLIIVAFGRNGHDIHQVGYNSPIVWKKIGLATSGGTK